MTDPDPRVQIRSFRTDLELTDQRTVEGRLVPYGEVAKIAEPRESGVLLYREQFVRGAFERATRPGVANRVALVYSHSDSFPDRLGFGLEFRETDDGLYGTFRLDESTAAKARDVLSSSHQGLSVSFVSIVPKAFTETPGALVTRAAAHLRHVAAVPQGAYAGALITSIREDATEDGPSAAEIAEQAAREEQARQLAWIEQETTQDRWAAFRG